MQIMSSLKVLQTKQSTHGHDGPVHSIVTLDLLLFVLSQTLFHPFLAALLPLCLRALGSQYSAPSFIVTACFASLISLYHAFSWLNQRLAFGWPREINWEKEKVVITGGKGGLGAIIAEILSIKGVDVAVLDISVTREEEDRDPLTERGTRFFRCDVSNANEVEKVWKRVVDQVRETRPLTFAMSL